MGRARHRHGWRQHLHDGRHGRDRREDAAEETGAINGGLMDRTSDLSVPVITIGVDSIDDSLKKVEAGGGSTITPRTPIPNMGAFAYFRDTEGNVIGLWETAM